jgi:tetratricopeptide (TPR) repeat protein
VNDDAIFLGIYAKISGPGAEPSGRNSKWHVWGNNDGSFLAQQLLPDEKQNGPLQTVSADDFFNDFRVHAAFSAKAKVAPKPAPGDAYTSVAQKKSEPKQVVLQKTNKITPAPKEEQGSSFTYYSQKKDTGQVKGAPTKPLTETPPGKPSPERTSKQPDETVYQKVERRLRSDFSLALIRLGSHRDEAIKMLTGMIAHRGPFAENHKFMFSEFGLAMRKRKLLVLSTQFHEKAHALSPKDEHILFNLARVFYESGKYDKAKICLEEALAIAPEFKPGRDFLDFIAGN